MPLAIGGFAHYWRDNDSPDLPWHGPTVVAPGTSVEAICLIQSNFGDPGNLEVVVRIEDQLAFAWRDSGPAFQWQGLFFLTPT